MDAHGRRAGGGAGLGERERVVGPRAWCVCGCVVVDGRMHFLAGAWELELRSVHVPLRGGRGYTVPTHAQPSHSHNCPVRGQTHTRARAHTRACSLSPHSTPRWPTRTQPHKPSPFGRGACGCPDGLCPPTVTSRGRGLCSCPVCLTARTDALNALLDQKAKANVRTRSSSPICRRRRGLP